MALIWENMKNNRSGKMLGKWWITDTITTAPERPYAHQPHFALWTHARRFAKVKAVVAHLLLSKYSFPHVSKPVKAVPSSISACASLLPHRKSSNLNIFLHPTKKMVSRREKYTEISPCWPYNPNELCLVFKGLFWTAFSSRGEFKSPSPANLYALQNSTHQWSFEDMGRLDILALKPNIRFGRKSLCEGT